MLDIPNEQNENKEKKEGEVKEAENLLKKADKEELELLAKIGNLYQAVNAPGNIDIQRIKDAVDSLSEFNKIQEYDYLHNLLVPERCKGVKIPSPIPVPSCAFQMHNSVTLTTNSNGFMCAMFNPFFLSTNALTPTFSYNDSDEKLNMNLQNITTLWVNNDESLNGNSSNENFRPVDIGQCIPPVYDQYRLVSASLVVRYIGRLDNASGLLCGAVIFDESRELGASTASGSAVRGDFRSPNLSKYGNFELARDSFYHQENMSVEGLRMLYFPIDNSFEEYVKTFDTPLGIIRTSDDTNFVLSCPQDYYKSGFNFFFYSINAPPNTACFKVDIYCNFECLPNASFLNYLPLSMNAKGISSAEKQKANLIVQQKPVMKANEGVEKVNFTGMPTLWKTLKDKFSGKLPGLARLFGKGLMTALSGWKTGVALSNALGSFMSGGGIGGMAIDNMI